MSSSPSFEGTRDNFPNLSKSIIAYEGSVTRVLIVLFEIHNGLANMNFYVRVREIVVLI